MSSDVPSRDTPQAPERRVIPISMCESWMRQFANRCRKELDIPLPEMMSSEDFQKAGSLFSREYLAQKDSHWAFPEGEEGIENMQTLVVRALFFLNDEQLPPPPSVRTFANELMKHAMHAYRKYLAMPETQEPMEPAMDSVAQAYANRVRLPADRMFRTQYFNAISSFGTAVAPNMAFAAFGKPAEFHQAVAIVMAKLDVAARQKCGQALDPATKNRIHTAILMGLENMRQNQPAEVAPDHSQTIRDFTKRIRGRLDFPGQFPSEEQQS